MKVLVACEFSGIVRDAFIAEGHDAISCDLLPTERPGPHIQGDVRPLLLKRWDLVIAHPPCTYLTNASAKPKYRELIDAGCFFNDCLLANAPMVAVENPMPFRAARQIIGEPDCIVHPYHFGDMYLKRTCFWLRGLPYLMPTLAGSGPKLPSLVLGSNSRKAGRRELASHNSKARSRFHPGMAAAMAKQWGGYAG